MRSEISKRHFSAASFVFWAVATCALSAWAAFTASPLLLKISKAKGSSIEVILLKNMGMTALLIATGLLALVSFIAVIANLRRNPVTQPLASVLLISAAALRSIELIYLGSASMTDADVLGALLLGASLVYGASPRLWWTLLMPLGTAASFAPLVWLEFFKGAGEAALMRAAISPAVAVILSSILIIARELRSRSVHALSEVESAQERSVALKKQMHSMEMDLKTLLSTVSKTRISAVAQLSGGALSLSSIAKPSEIAELGESQFIEAFQAVDAGPVTTTDYSKFDSVEETESSSYEDIDTSARLVLDEARVKIGGNAHVRLLLTAPSGAGLPLAVRGSKAAVTNWMKALIANAIDSLGGFPNGVVRVTLRPGVGAISISIEDNGRGFAQDMRTKLGAIDEDRMTTLQIRKAVEAVGGRFDIHSRLGVGARISIELPRIDAHATVPRTNRSFAIPQRPSDSQNSLSN